LLPESEEVKALGWKCKTCGMTSKSNSLDFPIMHEIATGHKDVEPDLEALEAWGRVL